MSGQGGGCLWDQGRLVGGEMRVKAGYIRNCIWTHANDSSSLKRSRELEATAALKV